MPTARSVTAATISAFTPRPWPTAYAKYAADNVFWLTTGAAAGSPLRMATIAASPGAGPGGRQP